MTVRSKDKCAATTASNKRPRTKNDNDNGQPRPNEVLQTANRFATLSSNADVGMPENGHSLNVPPPSPIFIDDVINIQTLTKFFNDDVRKGS
ncbi:hypothetical protein M0802_007927 [Mischocyttarus mexicanus]|nr:hypothetical protein M0802_007927 [Mischocyttarus mexicanus]